MSKPKKKVSRIEKGISKVYIGSLDSNPLVAGQGVEILKNAGIQVETGILLEECINMNEVFFQFIKEKGITPIHNDINIGIIVINLCLTITLSSFSFFSITL